MASIDDIRAKHLDALWAANAHNVNENQTLQRAIVAQASGLDPNQYVSRFPGSSTVNTVNNNGIGWGTIAALAATIAGSGLGIGAITKYIQPAVAPIVQPASGAATLTVPAPVPGAIQIDPNYHFKIVPD